LFRKLYVTEDVVLRRHSVTEPFYLGIFGGLDNLLMSHVTGWAGLVIVPKNGRRRCPLFFRLFLFIYKFPLSIFFFFLMKKAAQFCNNSGCSFIRENKIQIKRSQANFFKTLIVQYKRKGENGDGNKHRSQKSCDMTPFKVFCP
jgi:hypothetical protein